MVQILSPTNQDIQTSAAAVSPCPRVRGDLWASFLSSESTISVFLAESGVSVARLSSELTCDERGICK